jgi:sugar lactone lactonase YvrE
MAAFGGGDLTTLFVTTIGGGGTHEVDPMLPDAGALFAMDVGVRGLPEPMFAGGPPAPSA